VAFITQIDKGDETSLLEFFANLPEISGILPEFSKNQNFWGCAWAPCTPGSYTTVQKLVPEKYDISLHFKVLLQNGLETNTKFYDKVLGLFVDCMLDWISSQMLQTARLNQT